MRPALVAVDKRYQAAADVDIECHVLEWPTMSDAIRVLRDLRRAADEGVSRNLEDILACASTWARLVSGTPLAPDALPVATSQLANAVRCHDETGLDSRLHPHLSRLAALLDALGNQPHPAAACLEEVISRYGRANPHDPPAVYIAVDADHAPLVKRWLEDEELDADVRAVTHLRDAPNSGCTPSLRTTCSLPHDPLVRRDAGWSHRRMVAQRPARHPRPHRHLARASPARP